jgi:nucleotide-binding universal stress UspA family protein
MKFLICIGGVEPSADTIRFGARIAKAFEANLSILYVQARVPHAVRPEIWLTREKLSEWEIEIPGVKVLRAARALLVEQGFVKTGPSGEIVQRHALKPGIRGAYELHIYGIHGEDIRLRLREGDVINEVNKEVESDQHDLVIFGASQKRNLLKKLIQFIDCSMLIIKNPGDVKYEFLICSDSSPASHRAELFGAKLARSLDAPVLLLSVAKHKNREHVAMEGAERASRFLARAGVRHTIVVRVGNVVDQIAAHAREDTVVVMGRSEMSELRKLFFGSKSMKVVEAVNCPVLIVK